MSYLLKKTQTKANNAKCFRQNPRAAVVISALALASLAQSANAAVELNGTQKLACEAVLCLSSSVRPGECAPALSHYFGISFKRWSETVKARRKFLGQCPWQSGSEQLPDFIQTQIQMNSLMDVIAQGAGRCTPEFLNAHNTKTVFVKETVNIGGFGKDQEITTAKKIVLKSKPAYCVDYDNHEYTVASDIKYVGEPEKGGKWVLAQDYEQALAQYNEEQAQKAQQEKQKNERSNRYPVERKVIREKNR
ncbi:TrbM/KikA/MpfK family conjugal transfer protein [Brackiella oedipodis]|uniref:TrbM/KikA/MpfK family conjugal transfer protein n=1 Tax=Brackiella oedipodis TaxID=124225 RepID=UPI0006855D80|nr:TrbM/KikA/MpfK family conjugal transfer protein [Brackiella oedipodis]